MLYTSSNTCDAGTMYQVYSFYVEQITFTLLTTLTKLIKR